jgi:hypothetical protein
MMALHVEWARIYAGAPRKASLDIGTEHEHHFGTGASELVNHIRVCCG